MDNTIKNKFERQLAWEQHCKDKKFSVEEANKFASIIPKDSNIKVLEWPKL